MRRNPPAAFIRDGYRIDKHPGMTLGSKTDVVVKKPWDLEVWKANHDTTVHDVKAWEPHAFGEVTDPNGVV